jgi:glycosyltransferase involved in cell wall biosynthesis
LTPRVSIVLPVRDAWDTLDACMDSIRRQTFEDFEVVAVDDGSADGSTGILARWAGRDPRIRHIRTPRRGLVPALNLGLSAARAVFVARMDADDLMEPQRLALQHRRLASDPALAVVGSRIRLFPEELIRDGYRHYADWQNACVTPRDIADEIYVEAPFAHPSVMFRAAPVRALGGYREGPFPEDYDLWLRLHRAGRAMAKIPRVLLHWRERPNRTSRTDPRYGREAFDRLRAEHLAADSRLAHNRDRLVIWGAGRRTRRRCVHLLSRGFRPRAWIDVDPRKIGNRLGGAPVVAPDWLDRRPRPFVLGYVASHGARALIAGRLHAMGYERGRDYLMVG